MLSGKKQVLAYLLMGVGFVLLAPFFYLICIGSAIGFIIYIIKTAIDIDKEEEESKENYDK